MLTKENNRSCDPALSFEECELAILRQAVDETEKVQQERKIANSEEVQKMIAIVEKFIIDRRCICYGGTAINNILPKHAQFYNKEIEIPDYDFFSPRALQDAKALADIFFAAGYEDVEAKAGVHLGTFKVFVNFIPMADITEIHPSIFRMIAKDAITVRGIQYAPANLLRLNMFAELSRPSGDVSRWEKVLKRLILLNEYYPLKSEATGPSEKGIDCQTVDFQRAMESNVELSEKIYFVVRDALIDEEVVFFGGYASSLYAEYMPAKQKKLVKSIPDFDVLAEDMDGSSAFVKERIVQAGITLPIRIVKHAAIGELIPESREIVVGEETVAFLYKPIACHNYNVITVGEERGLSGAKEVKGEATSEAKEKKNVRVATIDTMLSFYLAFLYADVDYYYKDRILCMAKFLFDVEQANRLEQKGVLKRFSIDCYGKQPTLESMRMEKSEMFERLKNKKGTEEYERWFLKYSPKEQINRDRKGISYGYRKTRNDKTQRMNKEKKNRRTRRGNSGIQYKKHHRFWRKIFHLKK
jgi:hypothetical protein